MVAVPEQKWSSHSKVISMEAVAGQKQLVGRKKKKPVKKLLVTNSNTCWKSSKKKKLTSPEKVGDK